MSIIVALPDDSDFGNFNGSVTSSINRLGVLATFSLIPVVNLALVGKTILDANEYYKARSQAVSDYRNNRENGDEIDSPNRKFPKDGSYTWDTPRKTFSKMRYDEGSKDKAWMKEKDRKYLNRRKQLLHQQCNTYIAHHITLPVCFG